MATGGGRPPGKKIIIEKRSDKIREKMIKTKQETQQLDIQRRILEVRTMKACMNEFSIHIAATDNVRKSK